MRVDAAPSVTLCATGRLQPGFPDPAGSPGRRGGSPGLQIGGFETEVVLSAAAANQLSAGGVAEQAEAERANAGLQRLYRQSGRHAPLHRAVLRAPIAKAVAKCPDARSAGLFDSHSVRKHGEAVAHIVMTAAQAQALAVDAGFSAEFLASNVALRRARIDPGTSADLTAATLLMAGVSAAP